MPTEDTSARLIVDGLIIDKFNVKFYGAKGDGSTNDTTAIRAAITAASSGGVVYFPAGTYKIVTGGGIDSSFFDVPSNVIIMGAGMNNTILSATSSPSWPLWGIRSSSTTGVVIKDLTINCNRKLSYGIRFIGVTHSIIERVAILTGANGGIQIDTESNDNKITDCWIYDSGSISDPNMGFGIIAIEGCNRNDICRCKVEQIGVYGGSGIFIDQGHALEGESPSTNNVIANNHVIGGWQIGIGIEDSHNNIIDGNEITGVRQYGIVVQAGQALLLSSYNQVINNHLHDWTTASTGHAIYLAGVRHTIVQSNLLSNIGDSSGIFITAAQGAPTGTSYWAQSTSYSLNKQIVNSGTLEVYKCITGGTSAESGTGPTGTGQDITDETCHWQYLGNHPGNSRCNSVCWNTLYNVCGTGIHIETGAVTKICNNTLSSCNGGILCTNLLTSSIVDAIISDVLFDGNSIQYSTTDNYPGLWIISQAAATSDEPISDITIDHTTIIDGGVTPGLAAISVYVGGQGNIDKVNVSNSNITDSRDTPVYSTAIMLDAQTGAGIVNAKTANNFSSGIAVNVAKLGAVILYQDGVIRATATPIFTPSGSLNNEATAYSDLISIYGVVPGDIVDVCPPTAQSVGMIIVGKVVINDYVEIDVLNNSGGSATPPSGNYFIIVRKR